MKHKPLVVHNDGMIFVIEDYHNSYMIEDELNKYATLLKAPSNVHTYKLDKYSLWSAAFMGAKANDIIIFLEQNSINTISDQLKGFIKSEIKNFWTMELYVDKRRIRLKGKAKAIEKILLIKEIKKLLEEKSDSILYFKHSDLYNLRVELIKQNVFLDERDEVSETTGLQLNIDAKFHDYQDVAVRKFLGKRI